MQAYVVKANSGRRGRGEAHSGNWEQHWSLRSCGHKQTRTAGMPYGGQKNGPFGLGVQTAEVLGTYRQTGAQLSSGNSHFYTCVLAGLLLSLTLLLLAERFRFQTSNQRLLISPKRTAFGASPQLFVDSCGCLSEGADGPTAWGYSLALTVAFSNIWRSNYTLFFYARVSSYTLDLLPATVSANTTWQNQTYPCFPQNSHLS